MLRPPVNPPVNPGEVLTQLLTQRYGFDARCHHHMLFIRRGFHSATQSVASTLLKLINTHFGTRYTLWKVSLVFQNTFFTKL